MGGAAPAATAESWGWRRGCGEWGGASLGAGPGLLSFEQGRGGASAGGAGPRWLSLWWDCDADSLASSAV